MDEVLSVS